MFIPVKTKISSDIEFESLSVTFLSTNMVVCNTSNIIWLGMSQVVDNNSLAFNIHEQINDV